MASCLNRAAGIAAPSHLKAFNKRETELLTVIVETPKGSRNKYAFDPDERIFALKKTIADWQ
jgi:inorganic pyrophosphatase